MGIYVSVSFQFEGMVLVYAIAPETWFCIQFATSEGVLSSPSIPDRFYSIGQRTIGLSLEYIYSGYTFRNLRN